MKGPVCIIGAAEHVGAHLTQELLHRGYLVNGVIKTTLNEDEVTPLNNLDQAQSNLTLFSEDQTEKAIQNCIGVFLISFPSAIEIPENPELNLVEKSKNHYLDILKICNQTPSVQKVILNSCISTVTGVENPSEDKTFTEDDWSDEDFLRRTGKWYHLARTVSEKAAWEYIKSGPHHFKLASVVPGMIVGPMIVGHITYSLNMILKYLKGEESEIHNKTAFIVDVRDVAEAHIRVYENPESTGRYLCLSTHTTWKDIIEVLQDMLHEVRIPEQVASKEPRPQLIDASAKKIKDLGLQFVIEERTLADTVDTLQKYKFYTPSHRTGTA
eukprot:gb/GECH01007806.1/.p1 GENE.gb/GECH01007806.1/~~gb/GECH01007806.1/.p1  ORF type:complete len:327 (+),score=74.34 gb/GECH01007806.1/:1-981(+)